MNVRHLYPGTTEVLGAWVTSNVTLDAQTIWFRYDEDGTWLAAAWVGTAGLRRKAELIVTPATTPAEGSYDLYVRVGDPGPVMHAGRVVVH